MILNTIYYSKNEVFKNYNHLGMNETELNWT